MGKREKINKFLEVSQTKQQFQMMVDNIIDHKNNSFGNELVEVAKESLFDYVVELLEEWLLEDELDQLIAWHSSPLANRLRQLSPEIMQCSIEKITGIMEEVREK